MARKGTRSSSIGRGPVAEANKARFEHIIDGELSATDVQDCPLFNLPAEIRVMIWEYSLTGRGAIKPMKRVYKPAVKAKTRYGANVDFYSEEYQLTLACPPLLAVCRLTRYEGMQSYYVNNIFKLQQGKECEAFLRLCRSTPAVRKMTRLINSVSFPIPNSWPQSELCVRQHETRKFTFDVVESKRGKDVVAESHDKFCMCELDITATDLDDQAQNKGMSALLAWVSKYQCHAESRYFNHRPQCGDCGNRSTGLIPQPYRFAGD